MMRARRRPLALAATCVGLAAMAGCASASSTPPAGAVKAGASPSVSYLDSVSEVPPAAPPASPRAASSPEGVNVAAFDALAGRRQPPGRARRSPRPGGPGWSCLTRQPGLGAKRRLPVDADKEAFINGDLVFTGPPPSGAPPGVVTWADGSAMKVPVLSEARVFGELTGGRQCPGCATKPLAVTAARPTTLDVAHEPRHRQRARLGVHPQGGVQPGYPGGARAGQLPHAVHVRLRRREKLAPSAPRSSAAAPCGRRPRPDADRGGGREPLRHSLGWPRRRSRRCGRGRRLDAQPEPGSGLR